MSSNKLKKKDLAKNLSNKIGYSNSFSKKLVDDFIEITIQNIKQGYCGFKNIGSFELINKKERMGRNPKTKKEFIISSRKAISFKASKKITNKLKKII